MGSDYKLCFEPITIKGVEYKNRIFCTPNISGWGSRGHVTAEQAAYYERIAAGGPALITMGNCSINMKETSDEVSQIDLSDEECILGLNILREKVEAYGAHLSAQINYCGRNGDWPGSVHYAPSPIPRPSELEAAAREGRWPQQVFEMDIDKIHEVIGQYVTAAVNLKRSGFKHIMFHYAHNNLVGQFFSPLSNFRTDQYGGSLENRVRFGLEILQRVRKAVGEGMVIDLRFSGEDLMPGGLVVDEAVEIAKILEPYVDIFHISNAFHKPPRSIDHLMTLAMYMDQTPLIDYTKKFRKEIKNAKIVLTTAVMNLDNAERALEDDVCDFVGMFRPFLADPDIVNKYSRNERDKVNFCIRCEYHNRHALHYPVGCAVNPMTGHAAQFPEGVVPASPNPRKIMVVGGGPAGMQAAITSVQRGHEVVLYERDDKLGGNMHKAATLPFKKEIGLFIDHITKEVSECGARIVLNTEVTPEVVTAENPDVLIIAVGADDIVLPLPGFDGDNVHFCHEADAGEVEVGENVVVIGAGNVGMETAIQLGRDGHKVIVLERDDADTAIGRREAFGMAQEHMAAEAGVEVLYDSGVRAITDEGVAYEDKNGRAHVAKADTVLLAVGMRPRRDTINALRHVIAEGDTYIVGDAKQPINIGHATNTAFNIASRL